MILKTILFHCFYNSIATPFGQLPVLYIGDKSLSGSQAIVRYLAESNGILIPKCNVSVIHASHCAGFAGSNAFENAKLHAMLDAADDVSGWISRIKYSDEASRVRK